MKGDLRQRIISELNAVLRSTLHLSDRHQTQTQKLTYRNQYIFVLLIKPQISKTSFAKFGLTNRNKFYKFK